MKLMKNAIAANVLSLQCTVTVHPLQGSFYIYLLL